MEDIQKWYRSSLPASIEALRTAKKSLQMSPRGLESIRRIAHNLQGSAASYGFPALGEAAELVERARPEDLSYCLEKLLSELIKVNGSIGPGDLPAILIIEHDVQMARLLQTILSGADREVLVAGTSMEAMDRLEARQISLVLLDLSLPDTDGRNFLVLLRERAATAGIPVIVLSGLGGAQPKTECYALGADAYFEKPLAPEVLKAAVSARLHRSVQHRRESRQDALTGLPNRAAFGEAFRHAAALAARRQESLCLILLDFDRFGKINESLGNLSGDAALRHAARAFVQCLRKSDYLARWGGDEFVILLPGTDLSGGGITAEKLLSSLQADPFRSQDDQAVKLSFSAGLVSVPADAGLEGVMAEADRCLYQAKISGRERLVSESDGAPRTMMNILLAEDDEAVARAVVKGLQREGFEVVHCLDGEAALRSAMDMPFALCILDLKRQAVNGRELLGELKRRSRAGNMPILMLTSLGSDQDVIKGFRLGADDYLVKPFSPFDLMTRVHRLLRR